MTEDKKKLARQAEEFLLALEIIEMCRQSSALKAYLLLALRNEHIILQDHQKEKDE